MTELALRRLVQRAVSRLGARVFRVNTGQAWVGRVTKMAAGVVILADARPIRMGMVNGGSDLCGWTVVTVTPEMVGQPVAVFTAIELKTGRLAPTREQAVFLDVVRRAGGLAGVARSVEEAVRIVQGSAQDGAASSTTRP